MVWSLASAEAADPSASQLVVILISLGAMAGAGLLTLLPMALARRRRHPRPESIVAAAVLWGLLAAGSVLYITIARMQWSKEWLLLVKTGYYDPQDRSGEPALPWLLWALLAIAYAVLLIHAARNSSTNSSTNPTHTPEP
jgi:hypothetical protein